MPSAPALVFLRHGETDWNVEGRLQGQRDVPLNERGRRQARRNGEAIAAAIPDIAAFAFVASPLQRARETMEIARAAMGLDPKAYAVDERLLEITFGDWEGFTTAEIRAREPAGLAAREADKWRFSPPGGESYERLAGRIREWHAELGPRTVVAAHGGVGRVLWIDLVGLTPDEAVAIDVPHDKVFVWNGTSASLI